MVPEPLRTKALGLLGDLRLFGGKPPPDVLVRDLMMLAPKVQDHDKDLGNQLLVLTLALVPPGAEEKVPEGLDRVALYWIENAIERLTVPAPSP